MYQKLYAEMASESSKTSRAREKEALERAISKLAAAEAKGPLSAEALEATAFVRRLWTAFISDLSNDENRLPKELRASLVSIGLWILREAELIEHGESANFQGLIDVNKLIADGLA